MSKGSQLIANMERQGPVEPGATHVRFNTPTDEPTQYTELSLPARLDELLGMPDGLSVVISRA